MKEETNNMKDNMKEETDEMNGLKEKSKEGYVKVDDVYGEK